MGLDPENTVGGKYLRSPKTIKANGQPIARTTRNEIFGMVVT